MRQLLPGALALVAFAAAPALAAPAAATTYVLARGGSEVGYDLTHPMHKVHGTSHALVGRLTVADGHLVTPARLELPLVAFDSGNASRDSNAALALDVARFPRATLEIAAFKEASNALEGRVRRIAGEASGRLALHGVTRAVAIPVRATVTDAELAVDATFPVLLSEYQVPRPALLFRPVDDAVTVTVHAVGRAK